MTDGGATMLAIFAFVVSVGGLICLALIELAERRKR